MPNPLSWVLHKSPEVVHGLEVVGNHIVELVVPLFIMVPHRKTRMVACGLQIGFQVILILSGNLSFLNWLTIVPSLQGFDDEFWCQFSDGWRRKCKKLKRNHKQRSAMQQLKYAINVVVELAFACLILYLSVQPTQNLVSSKQIMNTSFDTFKIVNTYGAFGSVGKERTEIVVKGK